MAEREKEPVKEQEHAVDDDNDDEEDDPSEHSPQHVPSVDDFHRQLQVEKHFTYFAYHLRALPHFYTSADMQRMALIYYALSALELLGRVKYAVKDSQPLIDWIYSQQVVGPECEKNPSRAGFRGGPYMGSCFSSHGADSVNHLDVGNLAMTYTALLNLLILGDDFGGVNRALILNGMRSLQRENGCFSPVDNGGESDMRFVYCACAISYLLNDWSGVNKPKAIEYIRKCTAFDYGFGQAPGQESHGGSTYCAVAALALMDALDEGLVDREKTIQWLLRRQTTGFQGRLNKPADTCYSFWIGGSLKILGAEKFINKIFNEGFLLRAQFQKTGGFGKLHDVQSDPMHSYMGLAGLSLMDHQDLQELNPAVNVSKRMVERLQETVFRKDVESV